MPRVLIVNADDFGQSAGLNRGIIEAYEAGIVTSASLMVQWPAAAAAAAYAVRHPALSVGLHVDLGEWTYRYGGWVPLYERVDRRDADAIEREVRTQLERCCVLLGRGPTHLDSHQHVHHREPVRSILTRLAVDLNVPLRSFSSAVRHCGDFYGQTAEAQPLPERIAPSALVALLRHVGDGVTELGCHPGYAGDLDTMYREERTVEIRTLCAPEVRRALGGAQIRLASFADLEVM